MSTFMSNNTNRGTYLVLVATSLHLVRQNLRTRLLRFLFVDVLHQDTLAFVNVTLRLQV